MRKIMMMILVLSLVIQPVTFADKKLKKEQEQDFDIVDYDRSFTSSEISFQFEGNLETETTYDVVINNQENFTMAIEKSSSEAPSYKNSGVSYNRGEIVFHEGKTYECLQSHTTYGDSNWAPGIANSLWKEYLPSEQNTNGSGKKEKESHYQVKVYDENGKLVKVANIKKVGEFSEADLNFDLGSYINIALGYDIEITNKNNGAQITISAAPSYGYLSISFLALSGLLYVIKRKHEKGQTL